ncbi:MAG: ABC transporter substrate-binding protein, partial [Betaproteobacteria bacterium]|nr:ABC transporter substrate-binding protein [Betaproteobacteria bacterium]
MTQLGFWIALIATVVFAGCARTPWNDPYPASDRAANILYTAFQERPKHLDPAVSYSSNEVILTGQIYEPPLQYSYLARPYRLEPLTAERVPRPHYLDRQGRPLPSDAPDAQVAYSVYYIHIKPGIRYQPHPAFARDAAGHFLYQHLTPAQLARIHRLSDFPETGTKELTAADYVYEIKRLASPTLDSPILGLMSQHIVGLAQYAKRLAAAYARAPHAFLDLRRYPLTGAKTIDRYTYRIELYGKYPQFKYWLAMPFFAPVPWAVDHFYAQPGMANRNLTLDWFPVGTGPYMLTVNDPNRRMVLVRNPNFHWETYPIQGAPGDAKAGLLKDAGRRLPFVDKVVFSLEKEQIPYWNKFLQGYYDASGIGPDNFDQAIRVGANGEAGLTPAMRKRGIRLQKSVQTSIMYMGFNMLDPVVGGYSQRARDLRQAISIAINYEAYIAIFLNGRGIPAQGPIPPGIFGHVSGPQGIDPYVYDWADGRAQRKPIAEARRLLAEAGY